MKFSTKAIHEGSSAPFDKRSVMPPIYMTSTFVRNGFSDQPTYEYTRADNPNFTILENTLAALENGKFSTIFSSGLGALTAMVHTLKPHDQVLAIDGVYGGTYRLFTKVVNNFGLQFEALFPITFQELEKKLAAKPAWLLFETPTNPLLEVYDIQELSALAHRYGAKVIVDNTFASPYCQNPLDLGADVVWHSTTKYIGGHSDVIGGAVITNDQEFHEKMRFLRLSLGVNPSPFDAWLITRGVKTLSLRMKQHEKNALALATFLEKHSKVRKVFYPGLDSHDTHAIAKKQMRGYSGMLSVEFALDAANIFRLIRNFRYFSLAESLGGVESLVNHPATMTHASIPPNVREAIGISDSLVRFSVGIEDTEDLMEDFENSLKHVL